MQNNVSTTHVSIDGICRDLFRCSSEPGAVQVEGNAADGGLVGRNDSRRLLNVCQVHEGHGPRPLAWVGQQGVVGVRAQTTEAWGREE